MAEGDVPEMSPEEASRSGAGYVRDEDLPMLAAVWLAQGYDSEELRELAGMTPQEGRQSGRQLLAGVLSSLGWPMRDWRNAPEDIPWLGYWYQIAWAQEQVDRMLTPYAAVQRVVEIAGDVPDLWVPADGNSLCPFFGTGMSIRVSASGLTISSVYTFGHCDKTTSLR